MHIINSNQKKEKETQKEENIQFITFRNIFNITKPFELARGTFMDTEHDYNEKNFLAVLKFHDLTDKIQQSVIKTLIKYN